MTVDRPPLTANAVTPRPGRLHQVVLIVSVVVGSWLGMQAVHELGHVIAAWATGGTVTAVVLDPFSFSRTDVTGSRYPVLEVWGGAFFGCVLPLAALIELTFTTTQPKSDLTGPTTAPDAAEKTAAAACSPATPE